MAKKKKAGVKTPAPKANKPAAKAAVSKGAEAKSILAGQAWERGESVACAADESK